MSGTTSMSGPKVSFQLSTDTSNSSSQENDEIHSEEHSEEEEDPDEELTLGSLDTSGAPADHWSQLQEQMVGVLLEKQQAESELKYVRDDQMKALLQQLQLERERSRQLADQLRRPSSLNQKGKKSKDGTLYKSKSLNELALRRHGNGESSSFLLETMGEENEDDVEEGEEAGIETTTTRGNEAKYIPLARNLVKWAEIKFEELKDDFSEVAPHSESMGDPLGDTLNPFKLKKNLLRFGNVTNPLIDMSRDVLSILRWENPPISFLVFLVYMYSVYKGWLLTLGLLLVGFTFLLSYFRYKGFHLGTDHLQKSSSQEFEISLGMRDQIALMFHVSRRSQNDSGMVADALEKLRNLILWRDAELTKQVASLTCMALLASFLMPANVLFTMAGMYMGVQVFIIDYIFYRFPRIKQKYDVSSQLLGRLATDADFEARMKKLKKEEDKSSPISSGFGSTLSLNSTCISPASSMTSLSPTDVPITSNSFSETFQLPATEHPVALWEGGRRCTLVNKDRSLTAAFKIGRMILTNNYLCFERYKVFSPKNICLPLDTIVSVEKAKLYNWIPGGGKAIEVKAKSPNKTYVFVFQIHLFGAIVNRDEAFDSIVDIGRRNGHYWARAVPPK